MPPGITEASHGGAFTLTYRWKRQNPWFLAFFCLAWDSFLVLWYAAALARLGSAQPMDIAMVVFPLGHVAVGLGMTYHVLTTLLNRTTFTAGDGRFIVRHGPLPWFGNLDVDASSVSQLYVVRSTAKRSNGPTWKLLAHISDVGREVLTGLPDLHTAQYMEARLEEHLGLEDVPMAGEAKG